MYQGISLTQAPPFGVVVSFFCNGLVYLFLAGVVMLGTDFFLTSDFIALLHCFSIGFLLCVMFGALIQMLPVLGGVRLSYPKLVCALTLINLNVGLLCFLFGFIAPFSLLDFQVFLIIACICLPFGVGIFICNVFVKLVQIKHFTPSLIFMICALCALVAAVVFGVFRLGSYAGIWSFEYEVLLASHVSFGAFGWILALIVGVMLQVLPMFYVAPNFKKSFYKGILPSLFGVLLVALVLKGFLGKMVDSLLFGIFGALLLSVSMSAFYTLKARKRKLKEPSIFLWNLGFACFFLSSLLFFSVVFFPYTSLIYGAGVLVLCGILSIVFGMLCKIVPFLAWFHLSYNGVMSLPSMQSFITPKMMKALVFGLCGFCLCALVGLVFHKILIFSAFFLLFLSLLLMFGILRSFYLYKKILKTSPKLDLSVFASMQS